MIFIKNKKNHIISLEDFPVHRGYILGNPYDWRGSKLAKFSCGSRDEAIELYKKYFNEKVEEKNEEFLGELRKIYKRERGGLDTNLICFCHPKKCHATIIKEFIEQKLNEQRIANKSS